MGEHGESTHGYYAYNSTIWIPLIIISPDFKPGRTTQVVCHVDLFPTVCDILKIKKPSFLSGISLVPALKGKKLPGRHIYFESLNPFYAEGWAPLKGFIYNKEKFIESPIPELYDLEKDFHETENLAGKKDLNPFKKTLKQVIEGQTPAHHIDAQRTPDYETRRKLESLGYISGTNQSEKKTFGPEDDLKTKRPLLNKAASALRTSRSGQKAEAVRMLQEVITESQDIDLAYSNLAMIFKANGRLNDALEVLRTGMNSNPQSYSLFFTYVEYLSTGRYFDDVIDIVEQTRMREMEFDPELWNHLGIAYSSRKETEKALKAFSKSLNVDNNFPTAYHNRGMLYLALYEEEKIQNFLSAAEKDFRKAISLNPESPLYLNSLGAVLKKKGNLDEAVKCWEQALSLDPQFGNALFNIGVAYLDSGQKEKALTYFTAYKKSFGNRLSEKEKQQLELLVKKCH